MLEEMELGEMYTRVRLEDVLPTDESVVLTSIAVSLRRIAEALDRDTYQDRLTKIEVKMVNELSRPSRSGRKTLSEAIIAVRAFLEKREHLINSRY